MDVKKIKSQARKIIEGRLWEILKPFTLVMLLSFCLYSVLELLFPQGSSTRLSLLCDFAICPLIYGANVYVLNLVRKKTYDIKMLFSYYHLVIYIWALNFLISLFISLWSLLLIVPGIIASIGYSMAQFIMIDGTKNPLKSVNKSKQMMFGYKWDYLKFLLSFSGYFLLVIVTFGLALIYVMPYLTVSKILYYEELKNSQELG